MNEGVCGRNAYALRYMLSYPPWLKGRIFAKGTVKILSSLVSKYEYVGKEFGCGTISSSQNIENRVDPDQLVVSLSLPRYSHHGPWAQTLGILRTMNRDS